MIRQASRLLKAFIPRKFRLMQRVGGSTVHTKPQGLGFYPPEISGLKRKP
jgi:hypothetical protein